MQVPRDMAPLSLYTLYCWHGLEKNLYIHITVLQRIIFTTKCPVSDILLFITIFGD